MRHQRSHPDVEVGVGWLMTAPQPSDRCEWLPVAKVSGSVQVYQRATLASV